MSHMILLQIFEQLILAFPARHAAANFSELCYKQRLHLAGAIPLVERVTTYWHYFLTEGPGAVVDSPRQDIKVPLGIRV